MSDERPPSEVLGALPRTRPHRRSNKRGARPKVAQARPAEKVVDLSAALEGSVAEAVDAPAATDPTAASVAVEYRLDAEIGARPAAETGTPPAAETRSADETGAQPKRAAKPGSARSAAPKPPRSAGRTEPESAPAGRTKPKPAPADAAKTKPAPAGRARPKPAATGRAVRSTPAKRMRQPAQPGGSPNARGGKAPSRRPGSSSRGRKPTPSRSPASSRAAASPPRPAPSRAPAPMAKRTGRTDVLGTAVQAAAELAEIGLSVGVRAIRRAVSRLPRP